MVFAFENLDFLILFLFIVLGYVPAFLHLYGAPLSIWFDDWTQMSLEEHADYSKSKLLSTMILSLWFCWRLGLFCSRKYVKFHILGIKHFFLSCTRIFIFLHSEEHYRQTSPLLIQLLSAYIWSHLSTSSPVIKSLHFHFSF